MPPATHASRERALALAVAALAAGVILSFGRLHVDNNDASLYTLVAQDLARQRTPFLLHNPPMPGLAPGFYEHPPLWFWVQALALGAGLDLRLLGAACGVLTVVATFLAGSALVGARAAFLGSVLLLATDAFSAYQPMARLDPPLTLACAASIAILVRSGGRPAALLAGGAIAGLGVLVKGPPALAAPLSAALLLAALGRRDVLRRPGAWLAVAGGTALPVLAFLAHDQIRLGGAWWQHYVLEQVLASAAGGRRGSGGPGALWLVSHGRLMHVWPLAAVALARPALGRWAAALPP
ncbi:MAG TPA: glycosyltransferase family 39 protein, partial [Anaeromyxobacteraceae bacterium]|nr:glycosyltransferase family 39 protein [Anaeromyxobacteraceae bacterium]